MKKNTFLKRIARGSVLLIPLSYFPVLIGLESEPAKKVMNTMQDYIQDYVIAPITGLPTTVEREEIYRQFEEEREKLENSIDDLELTTENLMRTIERF